MSQNQKLAKDKVNILGLTREELGAWLCARGHPRFRGDQLYDAAYRRQVDSFQDITNMPASLRTELDALCTLARPSIDACQVSVDGTRKYRLRLEDGAMIEAVYIPEVAKGRRTNTLCVSSQVGCVLGCAFCYTATLGRGRDLTAGEIVGEVMAVTADVRVLGDDGRITNIVFMGMGEPLLNFEQVVRATRLLLDREGMGFASRRVTISTSGVVPRLAELGLALPTQLAVSLNATTDETRSRIMPINKKWGLKDLLGALRAYPLAPRRRITIEYVMLAGVNDTLEDARRLPALLAAIPVKVNLLPLNPHERTVFLPPSLERVRDFQAVLTKAGMNVLIRTARGCDINAACGLLGEAVERGE